MTHSRRDVAKLSLHYFLEQFLNYHRAGLPKQFQHYFLEQFLHYHRASYVFGGFKFLQCIIGAGLMVGTIVKQKLGLRSKHKRFNALPQGGSLYMMNYDSAFPNLLFDSNVLTARRNFAKQIPHRAGHGLMPFSLNLFTEQADQMKEVISEVCKASARARPRQHAGRTRKFRHASSYPCGGKSREVDWQQQTQNK